MTAPPTPAQASTTPPDEPGRVVDRTDTGWHRETDGMYRSGTLLTIRMSIVDLARDRGPLRPVVPPSHADQMTLYDVICAAGDRAVATIAAACRRVADDVGVDLCAGRPGSWESAALRALLPDGHAAAEHAAAPGVDAAATVLRRWVTDPAGYTEVAETLAAAFGPYAAAGWSAICGDDSWITQRSTVVAWLTSLAAQPAPDLDAARRLRAADAPHRPTHRSRPPDAAVARDRARVDLDRLLVAFRRQLTHKHHGDVDAAVAEVIGVLTADRSWEPLAQLVAEALAKMTATNAPPAAGYGSSAGGTSASVETHHRWQEPA